MSDEGVHVIIRQGNGIVARYGAGVMAILPGGSDGVQQDLLRHGMGGFPGTTRRNAIFFRNQWQNSPETCKCNHFTY